MKEMILTILLAVVCFLMACLNLWNIFKDWFDKKYKPRKEDDDRKEQSQPKEAIPDIIGKTKFNLAEETANREKRLEREIAKLKEELALSQSQEEENEPILSISLETTKSPEDDWVDHEEEEIIPVVTEKERSPFSTGTTIDEFELVAKTLQGKPISKEEETQVANIIPKIEGTEIYNQFTKQIQGAEVRAMEILNRVEEDPESESSSKSWSELKKYIRM